MDKRQIPGFSRYIATSEGGIIGINGQNLLATPRPDGYRQVEISDDAGEYKKYIHEQDTDLVKRCRKCNVVQPRANFGLKKASKDGISAYCKPCSNNYPRRK